MKMRILSLLVLAIAVAAPARSATYYVSPNGSNSNPGTLASPFLTVQKGADVAAAGDTVVVQDGTYQVQSGQCTTVDGNGNPNGNVVNIVAAGTMGSPITFQAQHRGMAVLDGQNICGYIFHTSSTSSYIIVNGLKMIRGWVGGVNNQSSNNQFLYNDIGFMGNVNDPLTTGGHVGILTQSGISNTLINGNSFHDNGRTNSMCGASPCTPRDQNLYIQGTNVTITNNICYNMSSSGWCMALKVDGHYNVFNNTIYGAIGQGREGHIVLGDGTNDGLDDIDIENNVFLDPAGAGGIVVCNPVNLTGTNVIKNNIAFGQSVTQVFDSGQTTCSGTSTGIGSITLSSNVVSDPLLVNPSAQNFRPGPGSPARSAGTSPGAVTTDYFGTSRILASPYDEGALVADSISVTFPGAGTPAISGGYGFNSVTNFTVNYSGVDIVKVCYTIDSYGLFNPGTDAPTTLGCSLSAPFSVPFNSYWYWNGPHQVIATAYNANGMAVAVSSPVPFTTANSWPNPNNPTLAISTSIDAASPWFGAPTITATVSGTGSDGLTATFFIDGIAQSSGNSTGAGITGAVYTQLFQNGTHNVCVAVIDTTLSGTPKAPNNVTVTIDGKSGWTPGTGEWCRTVVFLNDGTTGGVLASQALLNSHEVYLKVGGPYGGNCDVAPAGSGSCTLTASVLYTDGTTTASTPVCQAVDPVNGVYITGIVNGSLGPPANGLNSPSVVSISGCVVTAIANGAALVNVMTPTETLTHLAPWGSNQIFMQTSSPDPAFTPVNTGWLLDIGSGGSCGAGIYQISWVSGAFALMGPGGLNPAVAFGQTGNCNATTGPTRQAWVFVWPTNNYPTYGNDGSIQSTYVAGKSTFMNELFVPGFSVLQGDQPYTSTAGRGTCPGGFPCGISVDFGVSGFNMFETGTFPSQIQITGSEGSSVWTSNFPSYVSTFTHNGLELNSKFYGLALAAPVCNTQALYGLTHGADSSSTFIGGSMTAMEYAVSQLISSGKVLGLTICDEIDGGFNSTPLGGPYTFSTNGTAQSGLEKLICASGICTAILNPSGPPMGLITGMPFTGSIAIIGSSISGMNSVPATAHTSASGSTVTVIMDNQGSGYSLTPIVGSATVTCKLSGGGGTYSTCTPTVSGGAITGVTVSGASGYTSNPTIAFTYGVSNSGRGSTPSGPIYPVGFPSGAIGKASVSSGVVTVAMTGSGTNQGSNYYSPPSCKLEGGGATATYTSCTATVDTSGHVTAVTIVGSSNYVVAPLVIFGQSNYSSIYNFSFSAPGVADGCYNADGVGGCTADSGLSMEPYVDVWYDNQTHYAPYDSWGKWSAQMAAANAANGGRFWWQTPQSNPNGTTTANWNGNTLWPQAQSVGGATQVVNSGEGYWQTALSSYIQSRASSNALMAPLNQGYSVRSWYGQMDPTVPFMELVTATGAWAGYQGYQIPIASCVGNVITFTKRHGIKNIVPGLTRLWISGASDIGSPTDSCNSPSAGGFIVLGAPTEYTLVVALGQTNFTAAEGGGGVQGGIAHFPNGTMALSNVVGQFNINSMVAVGTPTSSPSYFDVTNGINGVLTGDIIGATWSANNNKFFGQQFTITGTTGSTTPTAACLVSANCTPTTATFVLNPWNPAWPSGSGGPLVYANTLHFYEVPVLSATGGTATILPDFGDHLGISAQNPQMTLSPGWAFGGAMECLFTRCSGARVYKPQKGPNGYHPLIGLTGSPPLNGYATGSYFTNAQVQPYVNLHYEDGMVSVPDGRAISIAGIEAARDFKFFGTPALNSPDCTIYVECAARSGAAGSVFFAMNVTDGPITVKTNLTPYETSGQSIIRKYVTATGIGAITVIAAGTTSDTVTLQSSMDSVVYTFPKSFVSELNQPSISVSTAAVPGATDVVVRYGYDTYYLGASGNTYDCGAGSVCTPPWDLNIGSIFYNVFHLNSMGAVLDPAAPMQVLTLH